jgi:hypothetical protein
MTDRQLVNSTHNPSTDSLVLAIIGILETAFPERIKSYYILLYRNLPLSSASG